MEFLARRKKNPPAVIIVALIDVLIVVLIFLLVTTTFKQQPALKLNLPESSQAKSQPGSSELNPVTISIDRDGKFYYGSKAEPLSEDELTRQLGEALQVNPQLHVQVAPDTEAPTGSFIKAMDVAKTAGLKSPLSIMTQAKAE